jgi:hypothetical protein
MEFQAQIHGGYRAPSRAKTGAFGISEKISYTVVYS